VENENKNLLSSKLYILNKRVSYQINTRSPLSRELTIHEVLMEIQSNVHKKKIFNLRNLLKDGNKEEYDSHKRTLPAVTFCGVFDKERKKASLKNYNSVIVLDIDKLDINESTRIKKCFQIDAYVFACWDSPSQEGLKGLVSLHYNFELDIHNIDHAHKSAFKRLSDYFAKKYNIQLDKSGGDTTRLCFFSYDPAICIKTEIVDFEIDEIDLLPIRENHDLLKDVKPVHVGNRDAPFNPRNRNKPNDRYTISAIIKFLERKKYSITYSYDEWFKVAMAIANRFTYDVDEKYFLRISSFDKEKFSETNCRNFLINCYESRSGEIRFNTIIYFANKKGYITKKQRDRGSEAASSQVSSSNTVNHSPEDLKE
jgi:hypothetical protein